MKSGWRVLARRLRLDAIKTARNLRNISHISRILNFNLYNLNFIHGYTLLLLFILNSYKILEHKETLDYIASYNLIIYSLVFKQYIYTL
jgi:hypothetical protein